MNSSLSLYSKRPSSFTDITRFIMEARIKDFEAITSSSSSDVKPGLVSEAEQFTDTHIDALGIGKVKAKKKYKPVALKARPVAAPLPAEFRIVRHITNDPMAFLPEIVVHNFPEHLTRGRYTEERADFIQSTFQDFLWPEEQKMFHHLMMDQEHAFEIGRAHV